MELAPGMSVSRGGIDSRASRLLRRSVRKICSGGADGCSALAFDPPGCGHSVACPADQSVSAHDAQPSPSSSLLGGTRAVPSRVIRGPCTTDQQTDSFPGTLNLGCMPPSEPPQDHRSEQSAAPGACGATIPPDITRPPAETALPTHSFLTPRSSANCWTPSLDPNCPGHPGARHPGMR